MKLDRLKKNPICAFSIKSWCCFRLVYGISCPEQREESKWILSSSRILINHILHLFPHVMWFYCTTGCLSSKLHWAEGSYHWKKGVSDFLFLFISQHFIIKSVFQSLRSESESFTHQVQVYKELCSQQRTQFTQHIIHSL